MERITLTKNQRGFNELRWLVQACGGDDGRYCLKYVRVSDGGRKYDACDGARLHRLTVEPCDGVLNDGVYLISATTSAVTIDKVDSTYPETELLFKETTPVRAEGQVKILSEKKKPDTHKKSFSTAVGKIIQGCFGYHGFRIDFLQDVMRPLNGKDEETVWSWKVHGKNARAGNPIMFNCDDGTFKRAALVMPYKANA